MRFPGTRRHLTSYGIGMRFSAMISIERVIGWIRRECLDHMIVLK
jgi:hypothetical protein